MKLRIVMTLIILAGMGTSGFYFKDEAKAWVASYVKPNQADPIPTLRLVKRDYEVTVKASGELTGLEMTPVSAPRVRTGSLKIAWLAKEGSIVQPGDTVVRFDNSDALLRVRENQNTVAGYRSRIGKSEEDNRSQKVVQGIDLNAADLDLTFANSQVRQDPEIFSRWEIEESIMSAALAGYKKGNLQRKGTLNENLSQADLKILGIERRRAESEMGLAQQTLDSLEVRAPLEGVVLYQRQGFNDIDVGSEVWPGQPLVDLANLRQFQGRFNVVESDMSGIERGKKAQVVLNAFPGQMFTGTIKQVGAAAQQLSYQDPRKYFVCEVVLDVPLEVMQHLKPGMRLTGEILVGVRKDALVVPKSAVIKKDAAFLVYVRSGQEYRERPVKIVDGDYGFYVLDGVREGESVCLQHPFEKQKLHLPDFSAPAASTQGRRFSIRIMG